jgi:hypothetical protein
MGNGVFANRLQATAPILGSAAFCGLAAGSRLRTTASSKWGIYRPWRCHGNAISAVHCQSPRHSNSGALMTSVLARPLSPAEKQYLRRVCPVRRLPLRIPLYSLGLTIVGLCGYYAYESRDKPILSLVLAIGAAIPLGFKAWSILDKSGSERTIRWDPEVITGGLHRKIISADKGAYSQTYIGAYPVDIPAHWYKILSRDMPMRVRVAPREGYP